MKRLLALLLLLLAARGFAETLPREFTITPTVLKDTPAYLTQVVVPAANCAAVSDAASLLVIGRRGKDGKQVAILHLDSNGLPSGEPAWLTLPKPEALAQKENYPLGLLFHPKLPLLYVWQDVESPPGNQQDKNPEYADYLEFDHLLIYAIKEGALELVQTGARGAGFRSGFAAGTIGLDYGAKNILVPNAAGETWDEAGFAYYTLDEEGLPGNAPEAAADQPAKPIKNLTTSKKSGKVNRPVLLPRRMRTGHYFPSGTGWFAGSDAFIMGGVSGCLVADFHNGGLRQTWFSIPELTGSCAIAGHPALPALYISLQDHNHVYQVGQVNGLVTLLPQVATVTGAHLNGTPVVMPKLSRLAIPEAKAIHLLGLQADGKLDGQDEQLPFPCAIGMGLAYSEKSGRLYVAVEKAN